MIFTDFFIRRPIMAITISLLIALVGTISFLKLPLRQYPRVDASTIAISTIYPGANADVMEGFVTTPIENTIAGVEGIDYIISSSAQDVSKITVRFRLGYDIHQAVNDISSAVRGIRSQLPEDIKDPVISENDPNSDPTIYIAFLSQHMTSEQVADYLNRSIQPILQMQPGVGQAVVFGDWSYAMRIWLDPNKMAAYHVTAEDIQVALLKNNVQSAAGQIEGQYEVMDVYANTELTDPSQFNNIYIRNDQGRIVRLHDVGAAELGSKNNHYVSMIFNGQKTLMMGIIPQSTANPLEVSRYVRQALNQLQTHYPSDLKSLLVADLSEFIRASLTEVQYTLMLAIVFVFAIILLMMGSLRAVLIPTVTIPLSILGAFALMLAFNYSLNTLTFLAFVLAIGLVVDDAIVVLENIDRHIAEGQSAQSAALEGAREIAWPVIVMTLTLAAVYAPIGFATGLTGKFFTEFAFTLAGAVIVSGLIALTLSPLMCAALYKKTSHLPSRFEQKVDSFFEMLRKKYAALLNGMLRYRYGIILLVIGLYGAGYGLYQWTPKELAPMEDGGRLMAIMTGPSYANLTYTEEHSKQLEAIYRQIPEIENYGIINGYPQGINSSISFISLKPWHDRKRTAMEIQMSLFQPFALIPGVKAFPFNTSTLPGAGGFTPIQFVLKTTRSYDELNKIANQFLTVAQEKIHGLWNLDSSLKIDRPQINLDIDRNRTTDLGISMSTLASTLNLFLGEPTVSRFSLNGRSYEVLPQLYPQFRQTPQALNNLYVKTAHDSFVPLSNIMTIQRTVKPESLSHFQQVRSTTITANLGQGMTLGSALDQLNQLASQLLPKDVQIDYSGASRLFMQTSGSMFQIFVFALLFIYIILAAQFENFRDPLIIMLSVPLSLTGGLSLLLFLGGTINIYTQIALITLIGLITKHGILIVEFIHVKRKAQLPFKEAIIEATALRLRPILMTTCAMLLGALPLALASGAGAVSRRQIGLVILGGMSIGTFLTLFIVPVAYYMFARKD